MREMRVCVGSPSETGPRESKTVHSDLSGVL
jgi:hypothetical protein